MTTLLLVLGMLASGADGDATGVEKDAVCHVPPGNPGNARTLRLPAPAIAAHLGHGDVAGACAALPAPAGGAGSGAGVDRAKRGRAKSAVCHVSPGNPGNARTLQLPAPAVRAHLRHGDTEGPCGATAEQESPR